MRAERTLDEKRTVPTRSLWELAIGVLDRVGVSPMGLGCFMIIAILPLIPPFNQEHMVRWLVMAALLGAQAVAFDFTGGYVNVINFGFAGVVGLGAYTSTILSYTEPMILFHPGMPPWLTIWIAALVCGLLGFLLGALTLRLRGIYAAVMAWFVGLALLGLARNQTALTRGSLGINPRPLLNTTSNIPYYYVILGMLALTYICLRLVTKSKYGLAFRCIGANMEAAEASGIDPARYRIVNFTLSCAFAGLLGGFYAHYIGILTPDTAMHTNKTVEVLSLSYIGGRGSLWGGIVTAFPFIFATEALRSALDELPGIQLVMYGVLMILVMIFYPSGLAGFYRAQVDRIRQRFTKRAEDCDS
jgi:branched-chain amino acid transport system permease protein